MEPKRMKTRHAQLGLRLCILPCMLSISGVASADAALSGNLALTSDYLFRGLSQTWGRPALQGGLDWNAGRWHAGSWASNVSRNSYPGGGVELDLYGDVGLFQRGGWSARAGLYGYLYPGADLDHARPALGSRRLDTLEANVSLTWKDWTLKYSRSMSDYFGADVEQGYAHDTRGTAYLQVDGNVPLSTRWSLHLHAGRTHYASRLLTPLANGADNPDYTDFSLAANYTIDGHWSLGMTVSHAGNGAFYAHVASFGDPGSQKDLGGTRALLSVSATF